MKRKAILIITGVMLICSFGCQRTDRKQTGQTNQQLVEAAFANWLNNKGTVFDLLDENVTWIVAGSSPVSGTYYSKQELLKVVGRINSKLTGPIVPTVESIVARDSLVIALWHGKAPAKNGGTYDNSYAWHMTFNNGKIVRVTAFLDTYRLAELLQTSNLKHKTD